ncbi:MAG: serine/threonine protein kinase [Ruminococcaceae bacterium]|nr:serine/threonine protein kinase [Oscillospiraceae bacterium]
MNTIRQFEPLWGVWRTEEKPLGQGSFGVVYRAWREEFGKKYYAAVKHISIPSSETQITDAVSQGIPDDRESLRDYFSAMAQNLVKEITLMNEVKGHTNIVSYEDHLIIPKATGIGYDIIIRMELLTGLNDMLRHRQMTNKDVVKLGIDICSALEVCLEKGIVHRDIKPSNIFVNDTGDYKLGDFGVARELDHTTAGMSKKGTYIYMAPEVYRGEPANFSADTFSLGIVMYRLLNGNRAPFLPVGSAKIQPNDNENALARRMAGEPLPAPAFSDGDLTDVILRATQFDKYRRFANPTEFKQALMCVRDGIPVGRTIPVVAAPTNNSASGRSSVPRPGGFAPQPPAAGYRQPSPGFMPPAPPTMPVSTNGEDSDNGGKSVYMVTAISLLVLLAIVLITVAILSFSSGSGSAPQDDNLSYDYQSQEVLPDAQCSKLSLATQLPSAEQEETT